MLGRRGALAGDHARDVAPYRDPAPRRAPRSGWRHGGHSLRVEPPRVPQGCAWLGHRSQRPRHLDRPRCATLVAVITVSQTASASTRPERVSVERAPTATKTVARRVLASFGVTVLAFAVTVGWSGVAQRRTAEDSKQLAHGYVPVALKLGRLRATQATVSTLVDGTPDERNPLSTKLVLETLTSVRRTELQDTRATLMRDLYPVGNADTRLFAIYATGELDAVSAVLSDDR